MFTIEQCRAFFGFLKQIFNQHCSELNTLDSFAGDGDHGFTMQRGFDKVLEEILKSGSTDFAELFDIASVAFAENSGGAIGPILSSFFAEGGVVFKGKTDLSTRDFTLFFQQGAEAVMQIGGARPGEKTILDAMQPAFIYLQENTDLPLTQALENTWHIAMQAAVSTKGMVAKHGRARFLGERSREFQDAGATSFALTIQALWKAANNEKPITAKIPQICNLTFQPHGKFINHPDDIVRQDNEGLVYAYPDLVRITEDGILVRAKLKSRSKVGLAIGHGGGHTPSMGGLIGPGLLDADVYGPIFTCASGVKIFQAIRHADRGAGVVLLVSNHTGDVLNARIAERRAKQAGIPVEFVILGDDIATASRDQLAERRGLGGLLFALKIGGAAAERGDPLDTVAAVMRTTNERTATLATALSAPNHPITGKPLFEIDEDHLEIGTGVHGEAGVYRGMLKPADEIIVMLMDRLIADLKSFPGKDFLMFLNGSGGTSRMELHILFRKAYLYLIEKGYQPIGSVVDSLFTTQEMKGFSLSLCVVNKEMKALWNEPASAPNFRWPLD